jgi:hypothetical protein
MTKNTGRAGPLAHLNLDLEDLTNAALKRLVKQLLTAKDGDEQSILQKLSAKGQKPPQKNDLADLHEQMHGKANAPEVEPDDGPDLEDAAEKKPSMNRKESKRG